MANAIFTTRVSPSYDDLPEERYHFPSTYLRQVEAAVGDWIVYYEPRRHDAWESGREGRQCYFATARVTHVVADAVRPDHYYAYVADFTEFINPVPFRTGARFYESRLRKQDGSTNRGWFGRAVRPLEFAEYVDIVQNGLAEVIGELPRLPAPDWAVAEADATYGRPVLSQVVSRKARNAAFSHVVRRAYDSTCALTGLKLANGAGHYEIEAVHIQPVASDGPDSLHNALALSRTVHWMFDRGVLSLEDDGRILMAEKLVPERVVRVLNASGYMIQPGEPGWRPHPRFLEYHRSRIFKG